MFKQYKDKSALDVKRGRYRSGGDTDSFPKRLGWWERDLSFMTRQIDDVTFVVTNIEQGRVDKISRAVYKRDDLGWLILQYNNIVDIEEEVIVGKILTMPSVNRVLFDITS